MGERRLLSAVGFYGCCMFSGAQGAGSAGATFDTCWFGGFRRTRGTRHLWNQHLRSRRTLRTSEPLATRPFATHHDLRRPRAGAGRPDRGARGWSSRRIASRRCGSRSKPIGVLRDRRRGEGVLDQLGHDARVRRPGSPSRRCRRGRTACRADRSAATADRRRPSGIRAARPARSRCPTRRARRRPRPARRRRAPSTIGGGRGQSRRAARTGRRRGAARARRGTAPPGTRAANQRRGLDEVRQDRAQLVAPAAGQQRDDRLRRIEPERAQERRRAAAGGGMTSSSGWPTHSTGTPAVSVDRLLEREDDQHAIGDARIVFIRPAPPGPELRADVVDDRDAELAQRARQAEVEVGKVDRRRRRRAVASAACGPSRR